LAKQTRTRPIWTTTTNCTRGLPTDDLAQLGPSALARHIQSQTNSQSPRLTLLQSSRLNLNPNKFKNKKKLNPNRVPFATAAAAPSSLRADGGEGSFPHQEVISRPRYLHAPWCVAGGARSSSPVASGASPTGLARSSLPAADTRLVLVVGGHIADYGRSRAREDARPSVRHPHVPSSPGGAPRRGVSRWGERARCTEGSGSSPLFVSGGASPTGEARSSPPAAHIRLPLVVREHITDCSRFRAMEDAPASVRHLFVVPSSPGGALWRDVSRWGARARCAEGSQPSS